MNTLCGDTVMFGPAHEDVLMPVIIGRHMRALLGDKAETFAKAAFEIVLQEFGGKLPIDPPQAHDVVMKSANGSELTITITFDLTGAKAIQAGFPADFESGATDAEYRAHWDEVHAKLPAPPPIESMHFEPFNITTEAELRAARPTEVFRCILDGDPPVGISMEPTTTDWRWLESVEREGYDGAGPTVYRISRTDGVLSYYYVF